MLCLRGVGDVEVLVDEDWEEGHPHAEEELVRELACCYCEDYEDGAGAPLVVLLLVGGHFSLFKLEG